MNEIAREQTESVIRGAEREREQERESKREREREREQVFRLRVTGRYVTRS